jgi:hypothetical protein
VADPLDPYLEKRQPGEPMFILLGRDSAAPNTLEWWADLREAEISHGLRPDNDQERQHIAEVRRKATEFQNWRAAYWG